MGIYDRDYVRMRPTSGSRGYGYPSPGGIPPMRTWSINTWIIVICVGVFMIDRFFDPVPVGMNVQYLPEVDVAQLDLNQLEELRDPQDPDISKGYQNVLDRDSNTVVGRRLYMHMYPMASVLHFSTKLGFLGFQFWRFIGFQFLHASFGHLIFNMIGLYFFGPMVERYLGSKRYLAFYLLSGICGAILYLILNLGGFAYGQMSHAPVAIPGLLFNSTYTPLIGASAGVFGVLMAGAFLAPDTKVLLFFIIPMPLRMLAYALVALALFTVITGGGNAGGEAGHLGGAMAGFYFIRNPRHLHNFFDVLGRIDPTSHHYRGKRGRTGTKARRRGPTQSEIDRILDKVHAEGLTSLSEAEKRLLRKASE